MIKKSVFVILALCLPLGFVVSTSAVEKKGPISGTPPKRTTTSMPMTEAECTGLGGKVINSGVAVKCDTGKSCVTVDDHGVVHYVCITGSAH